MTSRRIFPQFICMGYWTHTEDFVRGIHLYREFRTTEGGRERGLIPSAFQAATMLRMAWALNLRSAENYRSSPGIVCKQVIVRMCHGRPDVCGRGVACTDPCFPQKNFIRKFRKTGTRVTGWCQYFGDAVMHGTLWWKIPGRSCLQSLYPGGNPMMRSGEREGIMVLPGRLLCSFPISASPGLFPYAGPSCGRIDCKPSYSRSVRLYGPIRPADSAWMKKSLFSDPGSRT